jgi:lipopolysaccharide/colanic/teichoic acid biosynthesis glycosyltransferase
MYNRIKRFFDFVAAVVGIIILSPLLIPIVVGLKLTGEGYIFYLQERVGQNNELFKIWKFATMLKNSPDMKGGLITRKKDPRITPMGGFLRKTKINEIPQLINILRGEMSFVGPRPVMLKSFEQYPEHVQKVIYKSKPGITGIGSIIFRDEEEMIEKARAEGIEPWDFYTQVIYPYKGTVERWYQQHISFWTDLRILLLTAWAVLFPSSQLHFKVFKELPPLPKRLLDYVE